MGHKEMPDPLCTSKITSYLSCEIPEFILNKLQETYNNIETKELQNAEL